MKIQWHGHSCFQIDAEGCSLVFDPYEDGSVPGLAPLRLTADAVYCSHGHRDHNAAGLVTLTGRPCPVRVDTISTYHDRVLGAKRGKNRIHILYAEGMRLAHLGDLGCELHGAALDALRGADALLIPVGGYYTIDAGDAKRLIDRLAPRVVIPMHYRLGSMGYEEISELSDFTALCSNVVQYDTDTLTLTADTPVQTAVLRYLNG